jgi:type I restriction enzyme S subunit
VATIAAVNASTFAVRDLPRTIRYLDLDSVSENSYEPRVLDRGAAPSRARRRVRAGDSLIGTVRPNQRHVAYIRDGGSDLVASTGFAVVSPSERADGRFLYYALAHGPFYEHVTRIADGGAYPAFHPDEISRAEVAFPPLSVQRAISDLLGALDDKIELNRGIARTCHELAHAIFRSRYRSDDPDLPNEPLVEHVEVARGLSYTGAGLADSGIPLHNLNSIYEGGGYKRDGIKHYTGEYQSRHVVRAGDVIVANTEQGFDELLIACPALVSRRFGEQGLFSHHLYRVRPKAASPLTARFLYLMLLPGRLRTEIAGYANGTTVNMLPVDALQKPRFAVPPRELVEETDVLVSPLFDRAEAAEDESDTLAQLRDTLLPRLISGEVLLRVGHATAEPAR